MFYFGPASLGMCSASNMYFPNLLYAVDLVHPGANGFAAALTSGKLRPRKLAMRLGVGLSVRMPGMNVAWILPLTGIGIIFRFSTSASAL